MTYAENQKQLKKMLKAEKFFLKKKAFRLYPWYSKKPKKSLYIKRLSVILLGGKGETKKK